MPSYCIYIVSPPGYAHAAAFREVAEGLKEGLAELGYYAPIHRRPNLIGGAIPIVLGANIDPSRLPANAIIFNLEQGISSWWSPAYIKALREHEVWDYNAGNIEQLELLGITAKLCGIGYEPCLTCIAPQIQDIDVLFYGSIFGRREPILDEIKSRNLKVKTLFGTYGVERDRWIARSKIILNLHAYDAAGPFEIVRCSYLLANQCFILSEESQGLPEGVAWAPADELADLCESWVKEPTTRADMAARGFHEFARTRQSEYLKPLLTPSRLSVP